MMKLKLIGEVETLLPGLSLLAGEAGVCLASDGLPVTVRQGSPIGLTYKNGSATLTWQKPVEFYRLLGLLAQHGAQGDFENTDQPNFARCGVMLDCSRNGVATPERLRFLLRRMALMGLNEAMLYTEDTFEVPGYPYVGYLRGAYTAAELKELDDYAFTLGIELIPCIQTLGHLEKALKWQAMAALRDTPDVLKVGSNETRRFVAAMIDAITGPLRSKRIHLGMDEAMGLGCGLRLAEQGYTPALELLHQHLDMVWELCRVRGLSPMIWSDMCLRPLSPSHDYYDLAAFEAPLTPAQAATVPQEISLVYWDYYHDDTETYEKMIAAHQKFRNPVIFAGGGWTWNGVAPNYGKAFSSTRAGLAACLKLGVQEALCTFWFDNGSETDLLCTLPAMQLYAEYAYGAEPTEDDLRSRFAYCCGGVWDDFMLLARFDELPGVLPGNPHWLNPGKTLLYQDVLMGMFDAEANSLPLARHYAQLGIFLEGAAQRNPGYRALFDFYKALADLLTLKAEAGLHLYTAYKSGDKAIMDAYARLTLPETIDLVADLKAAWFASWQQSRKVFGFEVIDMRLGALTARLTTACERLIRYLEGETPRLEELEQPRLRWDGQAEPGEVFSSCNTWDRVVSASPFAGP